MTIPAALAIQPIQNQEQDAEALKRLAEKHLPLVGALVRRFPHDGRETEELYQQGCVGLMKALARYEPARGTSFSTYASAMILGEMRMLSRLGAPIHIPRPERELRHRIRKAADELTRKLGREPTIHELAAMLRMDAAEMTLLMEDVTVTSTDALSDSGTPLHEALPDSDNWLNRVEIQDLLSRLSSKDAHLLSLRYQEGLTQAETAVRLGMTQVQVSRRETVLRRLLKKEWYEN